MDTECIGRVAQIRQGINQISNIKNLGFMALQSLLLYLIISIHPKFMTWHWSLQVKKKKGQEFIKKNVERPEGQWGKEEEAKGWNTGLKEYFLNIFTDKEIADSSSL